MLDRRVALITGCGKPDGAVRAIAARLVDDGFAVVVTDRAPQGVPNAGEQARAGGDGIADFAVEVEASGGTALALTGDIGDSGDVQRMIGEVLARFGRIDVLVNNAAAPQGPDRVDIADVPFEAWNEILRVNLTGVFLMSQAVIGPMREQRYGRIVNISSMAGIDAAPRSTAYSASKAGVLGFTRALAMDVARWGITVNAICPGLVSTSRSMLGRRDADRDEAMRQMAGRIAVGKVGRPHDVANAVAFFADERTGHITAQELPLDGGGLSAFPLAGPDDAAAPVR